MRQMSFKVIGTILVLAISLMVLVMVGNSLLQLSEQQPRCRPPGRAGCNRAGGMQCYALEGAYPPNLEYLEDNYGLILDEQTLCLSLRNRGRQYPSDYRRPVSGRTANEAAGRLYAD